MTNKLNQWFFVSTAIFIIILSCSTQPHDKIIEIDANKNYPELDLRLSDIADISYIPLKFGKDTMTIIGELPRQVFVTSDRIFLGDINTIDPKIVVYSLKGEPLYRIGDKGNGPGELVSGSFCFSVDTIKKEVYIWGTREEQLYVFSLEGQYKKSKKDYGSSLSFNNIENINNTTLVGFNPKAIYYQPEWIAKGNKVMNFGRRSLSYIDKDSLTLLDVPDINFSRIHTSKIGTSGMSITTTSKGCYFFSFRSDTTFFMDDSLKITPKFVDVTKYQNRGEMCIFPVLETDKYIFLTSAIALDKESVFSNVKFLVYDKAKNSIYKIRGDSSSSYTEDMKIFGFYLTLNPNYLAKRLYYHNLKDNYDKLSDTLKRITDQMNENDNPVLMLIKFK
ncbi:MAG: hypothetical protein A2X18_14505 [Bacteroidetes bacterium GWF2_40_14]|nr:MAG: hypothetical protein A2X18_14505 [Bacteroidetes bacterium GWF2_40_14]